MTIVKRTTCSTAIAAALSLPLALGPVCAQQSQEAGQTGEASAPSQNQPQEAGQSQDTGKSPQQPSPQSADGSEEAKGSGDAADKSPADTLLATVGDAEIRGSDVMTVIGLLPPQVQSQPPQMLIPLALEQLILRELVLEKARSENLLEDPEVVALVGTATRTAEDDAMVQVWIDRELATAVTADAVQASYDAVQAQGQEDLPPLDEVRPQIEQHLRHQAMQELRTRLREGADIVLYDPAGHPLPEQRPEGTQSGGAPSPEESPATRSDAAKGQAEQAGMQGVESVQGATILKGKSPTNADVYMIVGPSGDLLALAAPLPGQPRAEAASTGDQSSSDAAPEAGEPAKSGYMATQARPATPNMWDPATVEQGMRQLELGTRAAVGEVSKP